MNSLVVRCVGNGEVATVQIRYDARSDRFHIAEIVPTADPLVQRRVNHEVFNHYPELYETLEWPSLNQWNMEAVEAMALGYLNRQSDGLVRPNTDWVAELYGVR